MLNNVHCLVSKHQKLREHVLYAEGFKHIYPLAITEVQTFAFAVYEFNHPFNKRAPFSL